MAEKPKFEITSFIRPADKPLGKLPAPIKKSGAEAQLDATIAVKLRELKVGEFLELVSVPLEAGQDEVMVKNAINAKKNAWDRAADNNRSETPFHFSVRKVPEEEMTYFRIYGFVESEADYRKRRPLPKDKE